MYLFFELFRFPVIYFPTFTVLIFIFDYEYLHFSVFLCCTMEEAETAFTRILGKRNGLGLINESVLVQEFLVGKEYVIDKVQNRESSCYLFPVLSLYLSVCLSLCHSISASPSYFIMSLSLSQIHTNSLSTSHTFTHTHSLSLSIIRMALCHIIYKEGLTWLSLPLPLTSDPQTVSQIYAV